MIKRSSAQLPSASLLLDNRIMCPVTALGRGTHVGSKTLASQLPVIQSLVRSVQPIAMRGYERSPVFFLPVTCKVDQFMARAPMKPPTPFLPHSSLRSSITHNNNVHSTGSSSYCFSHHFQASTTRKVSPGHSYGLRLRAAAAVVVMCSHKTSQTS